MQGLLESIYLLSWSIPMILGLGKKKLRHKEGGGMNIYIYIYR